MKFSVVIEDHKLKDGDLYLMGMVTEGKICVGDQIKEIRINHFEKVIENGKYIELRTVKTDIMPIDLGTIVEVMSWTADEKKCVERGFSLHFLVKLNFKKYENLSFRTFELAG